LKPFRLSPHFIFFNNYDGVINHCGSEVIASQNLKKKSIPSQILAASKKNNTHTPPNHPPTPTPTLLSIQKKTMLETYPTLRITRATKRMRKQILIYDFLLSRGNRIFLLHAHVLPRSRVNKKKCVRSGRLQFLLVMKKSQYHPVDAVDMGLKCKPKKQTHPEVFNHYRYHCHQMSYHFPLLLLLQV